MPTKKSKDANQLGFVNKAALTYISLYLEGALALRLRFRSFFKQSCSLTEHNLDQAIRDWENLRLRKGAYGRKRGMDGVGLSHTLSYDIFHVKVVTYMTYMTYIN